MHQLSGRPNFRGGRVLCILCGGSVFRSRWGLSELSGRENFRSGFADVHFVSGRVCGFAGRGRLQLLSARQGFIPGWDGLYKLSGG